MIVSKAIRFSSVVALRLLAFKQGLDKHTTFVGAINLAVPALYNNLNSSTKSWDTLGKLGAHKDGPPRCFCPRMGTSMSRS